MITKKHIKEIEIILNSAKITNYQLLQISFGIACLKIKLSNNNKYIVKFILKKNSLFNPILAEGKNLKYLNNKLKFFPKVKAYNEKYLIMEYFNCDGTKPKKTNLDFLNSIIKIHSISNNLFGFSFSTQIGGIKQFNGFEKNWSNFFVKKRLYPIHELANKKESLGITINKKIDFVLKNIKNLIPNNPPAKLLHGDMWEGNILFNKNNFVGFIDPGSFFGHNEMEVAYLRWFNPLFVDSKFLDKYDDQIKLNNEYLSYEPVYQLYYALSNVALWHKSYILETKRLLEKLNI